MYNSPSWTPLQNWAISVLLNWWKLVCKNHTVWPQFDGGDPCFLHRPVIPPPMWGSEDAHCWGFLYQPAKRQGFSKPSDRPSLRPLPGHSWHAHPMGTGVRPLCWQRWGYGRAGGMPAVIYGWKQCECRQLPSWKEFLGFSSSKGSGLVVPFAEADFALSQRLRTRTHVTVL